MKLADSILEEFAAIPSLTLILIDSQLTHSKVRNWNQIDPFLLALEQEETHPPYIPLLAMEQGSSIPVNERPGDHSATPAPHTHRVLVVGGLQRRAKLLHQNNAPLRGKMGRNATPSPQCDLILLEEWS